MKDRIVKRVLVMVDYGDGDADSGEVFDLTELARESATKCEHNHASITLEVDATSDYSATRGEKTWPLKTTIEWSAMLNYNSSGRTGHLDDAINASMPDSFATQGIRKKLKRLSDRSEKLREDIQVQRLMDAAQIRYKHPIARVTENPMRQIPEATAAA